MRTNVRIGNDIKLLWEVLRGGYPVNFNNATDIKVSILQGGKYSCEDKTEISTFEIDSEQNNLLNIEIQADKITELGYLWVVLEYTIGEHGLVDGNRKITIDNLPVKIVGLSDEAGQVFEFEITSDVVVGFDGKSAYEVWLVENPDKTLQDYFDWLQQPATDIATEVSQAEALRVQAETLRVTAEQDRVDAEIIREQQEADRQTNTATAIVDAENATENANTAAQNADDAREAIQTDLGLKLDKTAVKQVIGASITDVMSQKAVTDELAKKHQVVVDYTHTGNKEVNIESIDFATGTITATGHGLAVNNIILLVNKGLGNFPFSAVPNGIDSLVRYFVINVTPNTFQLSLTHGGAPITISDKATKDYSKWHFELLGTALISGLSLRKFIVEFDGKSSGIQGAIDYLYLTGGKDYGTAADVWITDTERGKIASGLGRSLFNSMANGDIWSYNRLDVDVTGKRASILINGYRIYSLTETTRGIIRHNNEVAVHSTVGEDVIISFTQQGIFNGINIKVTKIL